MPRLRLLAAAVASVVACHAWASPAANASLEGYSGLLHTPDAWVQPRATGTLLYTEADDPRWRGKTHTFALTLGFLPYVEPAGRITESRPGPRDLSFNLKLQAPLDLLWPDLPLAIAVGTQDEGGALQYFQTRYAVATLRLWRISASAGYGTGPDRLEGAFGGAALCVVSGFDLLGEWDGLDVNAGARLSLPLDRIGVPVRLGAVATSALTHDARKVEWGGTLTVPLCLNSCAPPARRETRASAAALRSTQANAATPPQLGSAVSAAPLEAEAGLEQALVDAGFEEVRVGRDGELLVVEYENNRFNHAEADGVAVVRGEIASAGLAELPIAIVLKRSGLRMVELREGTWSWHPRAREAAWVSSSPRNRVALHSRLVLAPGLRTFVATEVGLLDYVASFRPDLIVPLWPGATAFARGDVQLAWSDDLEERRIFNRYRHDPRLEYATLHQALPLARGLMAMIGGGLYRNSEAGVVGEVLWLPLEGAHALGVQGSRSWDGDYVGRLAVTGSWRGRYAPLDIVTTVRAGRFHAGDRGASVELSRWFGATELGFYYADTTARLAGVFVSVPLTPRRDMRPGWLQVRGPSRWEHGLASVVGGSRNPLVTGAAEAPMAPWNLEASYRDAGRLSRDGLRPFND